ncbi:A24 family peptidase [Bosea sp. (in: a-proteobacteria)]|uniref:prepilin peptidase n=1 Tax=Bosea sp. (in: a-proteobacteria) TaxID=1871050 RepID=UPI0006BB38FC
MIYVFGLGLSGILAYACWIDSVRLTLPNRLNLGFLATGLAQSFATGLPRPVESLIGVLAGGLLLGIIAVAYRYYRGFDGIGMGDVKFVAAAGAWIGWMGLPQMLLIASVLGLIYALG